MQHNYNNLLLGIEKSGCKNILPLKAAVWSKHEGHLKLGQHPLNSGSASIEFADVAQIPQFEVMAHPLDYLVSKFKPVFIKMDIEGAEYEVMKAVEKWDAIPHISIDMHNVLGGDEVKSRERKDWLKALCFDRMGNRAHLVEPFDIAKVDVPE
jgi:FkbM family methyltransferase